MTKSQEKAIGIIKRMAKESLISKDLCEVKKVEVKEGEFFLNVIVEVGYKEENLITQLSRKKAQLFVHKRGGITYPVMINRKYSEKALCKSKRDLFEVFEEQK